MIQPRNPQHRPTCRCLYPCLHHLWRGAKWPIIKRFSEKTIHCYLSGWFYRDQFISEEITNNQIHSVWDDLWVIWGVNTFSIPQTTELPKSTKPFQHTDTWARICTWTSGTHPGTVCLSTDEKLSAKGFNFHNLPICKSFKIFVY